MSQDFLNDLIITQVSTPGFLYSAKRNTRVSDRWAWGILIKASGETVYTCQDKRFFCNPNYVILAPCGCSYEFDSVTAGNFVWLEFQALQSYDQLIQIPVKNCQSLVDAIRRIESLKMNKPALYQMTCIAETYGILLELFRNIEPKYVTSAQQRKIQRAVDYLVQNYTCSLTINELAAQTGFSAPYFRRLFSDVYGTTPLDYQQTLRISKAKEMLKSKAGSISEIAAALGYSSIYDFSRAFKRKAGISPREYARSLHQ